MDRIPLSPPKIPSINPDTDRPLWSVMIPVFNCSQFLNIALNSVLIQDMGPDKMQIEVIDDCSTDIDVEKLVEKIGKGRISYYRQAQNLGSLRNFETCIKRANGYYVHLLHGDDCVKDGFYDQIGKLFLEFPQAGAGCCAFDLIDDEGKAFYSSQKEADRRCILPNWLYKLAAQPRLQFVCIVVKREVYEKLGSFFLATFGEDWEMWARIAKNYPTAYIPKTLAQYRIHANSISGNVLKNSTNWKNLRVVIDKISSYLAKEDQRKYNKKARKYCANIFIRQISHQYFKDKDLSSFDKRLNEIFRLYQSPKLLLKIALIKIFARLPEAWSKKLLVNI